MMKQIIGVKKQIFIISSVLLLSTAVNGQVLISLLLGDKLNNGKIEFGMEGGVNFSSISSLDSSQSIPSFNLGFYFDFKLKNNWKLHTGVLVKSTLGAAGIRPYKLNNPDLDNAFEGGSVNRRLPYFNVPVLIKYVSKNHLYIEGGFQMGLLYKPYDEFVQTVNQKEDLKYKQFIKDNYRSLDAGLEAGIGYRLMKGNGVNLAVRYYYGLVDITVNDNGAKNCNRSVYLAAGIPIGAGKAKEKREKKI